VAVTEPQPAPPEVPSRARRRRTVPLDLVVLAGLAGILAFPVLSRLAADRQPVPPGPAASLPPLTPGPNGALRALPAGLGPGPRPARLDDLPRGDRVAGRGAR